MNGCVLNCLSNGFQSGQSNSCCVWTTWVWSGLSLLLRVVTDGHLIDKDLLVTPALHIYIFLLPHFCWKPYANRAIVVFGENWKVFAEYYLFTISAWVLGLTNLIIYYFTL